MILCLLATLTRRTLDRSHAARHRHHAGARHLGQAEMAHQIDERIELVGGAGEFEHEALMRRVHHAGAERIGDAQRLDALLADPRRP